MAEEIKCPLCNEMDLIEVDSIKCEDIVSLWKKQNIDTSLLFRNIDFIYKYKCNNCGLIHFYPFVDGDDSFYSQLGKNDWYYLHEDKTEFKFSDKKIVENDNVLDIGSGRGAFTKYITKKVNYTGLELSSKAVDFANKENINVLQKTIQEFSKNNQNSQDVVVTFQVLEHISFIDDFIDESLKALKVGGLFIVAVPNNDSFLRYAQNNLLNLPPHHILHWNEKSLVYLSKKYDLELIEIYKEKVTNIHKFWFCQVTTSKLIKNLLLIKIKSIDISMLVKIINKISSIMARFLKFANIHENEDGHTIIAVYRKKK